MGTLDDPKLMAIHNQIRDLIEQGEKPNWQKVCEILNGMSMPDMLDEIWRIKGVQRLVGLSNYAPRATGVNILRLRAAIGAVMDNPPGDFDGLLRALPADQQMAIKSVRAVTQAPEDMVPTTWSKYYWSTRALAPPNGDAGKKAGGDDDSFHVGADIATALTANYPRGQSPLTYTVSVVFRNLDALKLGEGDTEVALLHEPNVQVQISPDPNNKAAYQAAISLVNVHLKRNWGLIKPDVEFSLGAQVGVTAPSYAPSAALQAQVEVHVTTQVSLVATSGLSFAPGLKPGDPPDRGAMHFGNRDLDVALRRL